MVKIIWTQRSLSDLKFIGEYISQDSEKYASLTIERILEATLHLENNPRIGRMVPEGGRDDQIRELILGYYRIIYKITNSLIIHILTIHHSSKRLSQSSLRRLK